MSRASDRRSTFSNQEGTHILQSSHFPMPSLFPLQLLVICLLRSVKLWSQSRPTRTATGRVEARAANR